MDALVIGEVDGELSIGLSVPPGESTFEIRPKISFAARSVRLEGDLEAIWVRDILVGHNSQLISPLFPEYPRPEIEATVFAQGIVLKLDTAHPSWGIRMKVMNKAGTCASLRVIYTGEHVE